MNHLLLLSGEHPGLAAAEAVAVLKPKTYKHLARVLLLQKSSIRLQDVARLAYTKKLFKLLFITSRQRLIQDIQRFPWKDHYKKNFCVRIINFESKNIFLLTEREIASYVWRSLRNPEVKLTDAATRIYFIFIEKKIYAGILLHQSEELFGGRRAHQRPVLHPSSMHPKLARAMVNLTGAKKSSVIIDPFCGTGGILLEAGLLGMRCKGYDINETMFASARINLKHYGIKKIQLARKDATQLSGTLDTVVTDLPYARNTGLSGKRREELYQQFFSKLGRYLRKRAVIGLPDSVEYRKLIDKNKLRLVHQFTYYLHKSLSKRIIVVEPFRM